MARKVPCQYCKQRRRKCERNCETEPCVRCAKMKRKCIVQDLVNTMESSEDDASSEDFEAEIEMTIMRSQVERLESELYNLELLLDKRKQTISKNEPVWHIEFDGKQLLLKSEIKSLEELLLYGRSVIRYLSPFGHSFGNTTLRFERLNPGFIKAARKIIFKLEFAPDEQSSAAVISQRFTTGLVQFIQPIALISRLVDSYFTCMNDNIPILHEASFRKHFETLSDPMQDPVTLAMCASSAISTCQHSLFSSLEKRSIGEYFYERAVDILTEMFDDPDRAFESLLVCNLLQLFMITTLRFLESKRWATVAVLLSANLITENPGCLSGNDNIPLPTRTRFALIHRNTVFANGVLTIMEYLVNNRRESITPSKANLDILPDEPKSLQDILEMFNLCLKLSVHPASVIVITQARQMQSGDVGEFNFEEIVRYEEVIVEWWQSLPEYVKICKQPYNCTVDMVQNTNELPKLLMACYIWVIILSVQGCLIQPKPKGELENVYKVVRDKAIYLASYASDIVLALAKKIDSLGLLCCYSPSKILVRSIDSLLTLMQTQDKAIVDMARNKLKEYVKELSKSISPDHQVLPSASPYFILSMTPSGSTPSIAELYKNYPLPGEALIFDIVNTTVNQNIDTTFAYSSL